MIENPKILKQWQGVLEGVLSKYLIGKYPNEMKIYIKFKNSTGRHCNFCKASARMIFKRETVSNRSFLNDFIEDTWDNYI